MSNPNREAFEKKAKHVYGELFRGYSAYCLFRAIRRNIAPNVVGKERAEDNVAIMNVHPAFFGTSLDTALQSSQLQIAKMIDKDNQASSLFRLLFLAEELKVIDKKTRARLERRLSSRTFLAVRHNRDKFIAHIDTNFKLQPVLDGQLDRAYKVCYEVLAKVTGNTKAFLVHIPRDAELGVRGVLAACRKARSSN